MAALTKSSDEINVRVVYYGPGMSGKTTNLDCLYKRLPAQAKGKVVSTKTRTDRTLCFDLVPAELGDLNGYRLRFILSTVPGHVYYNATRKLALEGADAVVFVADSTAGRLQENIESLRNLEENLNEHGLSLDHLPWVIQYNKRDLPDAAPLETLHQNLNLLKVPALEAVASEGTGVFETFAAIAGLARARLMERFEPQRAEVATGAAGDEDISQPAPDRQRTEASTLTGPDGELFDAVDAAFREAKAPALNAGGFEAAPPPAPALKTDRTTPRNKDRDSRAQTVDSAPEVAVESAREPQSPVSAPEFTPPPSAAVERAAPKLALEPESTVLPDGAVEKPSAGGPHVTSDYHTSASASQPKARGNETFRFEPIPDRGAAEDIGRLVELDEGTEETGTALSEQSPEFITDPMQRPKAAGQDQAPPELEQEPAEGVEQEHGLRDRHEIRVPVVITRSQVRKSLPLTMVLEIQIVDD